MLDLDDEAKEAEKEWTPEDAGKAAGLGCVSSSFSCRSAVFFEG